MTNELTVFSSWRYAYELLSNSQTAASSSNLQEFLKDGNTINILRRWLEPFTQDATPKSQAKRDFITKTASASFSHPAANEIKQDATWLADKAGLDELSALRIAVVEARERSVTQLIQDNGVENTQNDGGNTALSSSRLAPEQSPSEIPPTSFEARPERRSRLLRTYLSERLNVVRIGSLLRRLRGEDGGYRLGDKIAPGWLIDVAASIGDTATTNGDELWIQCTNIVQAAQLRVDGIATGSRWFSEDEADAGLEECWSWTHLSEMNAMLQYLFYCLQKSPALPTAQSILGWFQFVSPQRFFQDVVPVSLSCAI